MRLQIFVAITLVVFSAGCGGYFDTGETGTSTPTEVIDEAQTQTSGRDVSQSDRNSTRERLTESELRKVVISKSDLSGVYESDGQRTLSPEEASSGTANQFEQRQLSLIIERTFTLSDQDNDEPEIIFSSVMQYQSAKAADTDFERIIDGFRESDSSVSQQPVGGITATVVTFENNRGYQNTVYYGKEGSMVFYVVTSDNDRLFKERTKELFIKMSISIK